DVNFVTGDHGDWAAFVGLKTVGFPASSPFATSIGGTSLALDSSDGIAWQSGWGNNLTGIATTSATGNSPMSPPLNLGFQFGAGGGPSLVFPKPSWQSSLPGAMRQTPDISLLADPLTGVEIIKTIGSQLYILIIGGTSLGCPMFSAMM